MICAPKIQVSSLPTNPHKRDKVSLEVSHPRRGRFGAQRFVFTICDGICIGRHDGPPARTINAGGGLTCVAGSVHYRTKYKTCLPSSRCDKLRDNNTPRRKRQGLEVSTPQTPRALSAGWRHTSYPLLSHAASEACLPSGHGVIVPSYCPVIVQKI